MSMNRNRRPAYSDEYRLRYEAEQAQAAADEAARAQANEEARERRLATLEATRAAQRQRDQAAIDAELAPTKERLKRQWLADHPDGTAADFEARSGPLLRKNLVEDGRERAVEETRASLLATGQYTRF